MDRAAIITLLQKHIAGTIGGGEMTELQQWFREVDVREFNEVADDIQHRYPNEYTRLQEVGPQFMQGLEARVDALNDNYAISVFPQIHRIHLLKRAWFRYAAAAVIILSIGAYLWNTQKQKEEPSLVQTNQSDPVNNDVLPGSDKAMLTLSNGEKIELNATAQQTINEGALAIQNQGGSLMYKETDVMVLNTMTTPRGGQYQLTLSDGTKVWLNAESSITYPTAFTERERKVTVSGEAYFEVAKNKAKPFTVDIGSATIEVLGTHFNVNTYKDESANNITLLEGSVRINTVHTSLTLKPGQQGQLNDQRLSLAPNPDIDQVMAWRRGLFDFNNKSLKETMNQLSRWYDVDVMYEGAVPDITFGGKAQRNLNLSQVTRGLSEMGVKFRIEGKKLIVTP